MKVIDQIFENTISEYNKNASDINKFKFSEFEKIVFKNMMADYATKCVKASLEKASENARMKTKDNISELSMMDDWSELDKDSITQESNITLL